MGKYTCAGRLLRSSVARQEEEDHLRSLVAGVDGYLLKPVSLDTLLSQVQAALQSAGPTGKPAGR